MVPIPRVFLDGVHRADQFPIQKGIDLAGHAQGDHLQRRVIFRLGLQWRGEDVGFDGGEHAEAAVHVSATRRDGAGVEIAQDIQVSGAAVGHDFEIKLNAGRNSDTARHVGVPGPGGQREELRDRDGVDVNLHLAITDRRNRRIAHRQLDALQHPIIRRALLAGGLTVV